VRFLPDDNVAMAAVLAGDVDIVLPRRAGLGIIRAVRQQWGQTGDGALALLPGYAWAFLSPQFLTPQPEDLREVNVRRALSHALDRPAIAEAIAGDASFAAELWVPHGDPRAGLLGGAGSRHTYSPDRAQELLRETGWRREGTDDALVKHGQRFELELTATSEWHPVATLVADYWRRVGVVVKEAVVSLGSVFDRQGRSTYPGVELAAGTPSLALLDGRLRAANVPAVENLWVGANRGRYSSGEMEKALDRLWQALDPAELATAEGELARRISTDLPILGVLFYPAMTMVRRGARNVVPPETVSPVGRLLLTWNAHEWEKS
jgi:ABC-type transport system substrate-binding protein